MTNHSTGKARLLEDELVSPESVAYHRVSIELFEVFKHLRRKFWARSILITEVQQGGDQLRHLFVLARILAREPVEHTTSP